MQSKVALMPLAGAALQVSDAAGQGVAGLANANFGTTLATMILSYSREGALHCIATTKPSLSPAIFIGQWCPSSTPAA
jgi:hypothetical protein